MVYLDRLSKLFLCYTLFLYHRVFGVETSEIVFLLCILSINFDESCIESGIIAVERVCAFAYDIDEKRSGRLQQSVC